MFDITSGAYRCCDNLTRRSMLKVGTLAFGGLTLADWARGRAAAAAEGRSQRDLSVILLWQGGGPSHIDMWDLKPQAPAEFRGSFNPISTSIPGYQVCEHMPRIAKIVDKLSIIRSVNHPDGGHESATHFLLTGYPPTVDIPAQEAPSYGSIVGKECGPRQAGFPAYVAVPRGARSSNAGYLGVACNPFELYGDPNNDGFSVRNLRTPGGPSVEQLEQRMKLLKRFDTLRRDIDSAGVIGGMDNFTQQAWDMVSSAKVQEAFDINKESRELRDRYGRHTWGQSTLLARRLVESGVRFVTVEIGGWDTHANNFAEMQKNHLPKFDQLFSALIEDLDQRGRLEDTLVLVWGEFGRTPRINPNAGRDHWPTAMTVVMAGGGVKRGLVLGESDARAEFAKTRPVTPQDVLATMYHQLGVNRHKAYTNEANRPVEILNVGEPIRELL